MVIQSTTLHIHITFSSLYVIIYSDLAFGSSNGSFCKNPLRDRCELIYLLTKIIIVYMCKAVDLITVNVFYLITVICFLKIIIIENNRANGNVMFLVESA